MPESKPASQPRGETPTPRTDALLSGVDSFGNIPTMEDRFQRMCRHARTLERELTAAPLPQSAPVSREEIRSEVIEECAKLVPENWLDPLLTGPNKVIGELPLDGNAVAKLLTAIRARILAAHPAEPAKEKL